MSSTPRSSDHQAYFEASFGLAELLPDCKLKLSNGLPQITLELQGLDKDSTNKLKSAINDKSPLSSKDKILTSLDLKIMQDLMLFKELEAEGLVELNSKAGNYKQTHTTPGFYNEGSDMGSGQGSFTPAKTFSLTMQKVDLCVTLTGDPIKIFAHTKKYYEKIAEEKTAKEGSDSVKKEFNNSKAGLKAAVTQWHDTLPKDGTARSVAVRSSIAAIFMDPNYRYSAAIDYADLLKKHLKGFGDATEPLKTAMGDLSAILDSYKQKFSEIPAESVDSMIKDVLSKVTQKDALEFKTTCALFRNQLRGNDKQGISKIPTGGNG